MTLFDALGTLASVVLLTFIALFNSASHVAQITFHDDAPVHDARPMQTLETLRAHVAEQLHIDARYQQATATLAERAHGDAALEDALVRVSCSAHGNAAVRTTIGSGVFIDERGIILTNAHVAQPLLFANAHDGEAYCAVHTAHIADEQLQAALLYISPTWITSNAHQLHAAEPIGTGEHDFALLYIPVLDDMHFPALSAGSYEPLRTGAPVRIGGYPAHAEGTYATQPAPTLAHSSISRLFTFSSDTVDLFTVSPSVVGQHGSSGGPVTDANGMLIGLITTRGDSETEGERSLRALSIAYINASLRTETGIGLRETLAGDIELRAHAFRDALIPPLRLYLDDMHAEDGDAP